MKKLITLCLVAFTLVFGIQTAEAQEKGKLIDEAAKMEAQELKKVLGLDDQQTTLVHRIIYAQGKRKMDLASKESMISSEEYAEYKSKISSDFKSKMIEVLSQEQFQVYSEYLASKAKNPKLDKH